MGPEADAKPGLGTGIVEALAKQLDAQVHTESSNQGTKVTIASAVPDPGNMAWDSAAPTFEGGSAVMAPLGSLRDRRLSGTLPP